MPQCILSAGGVKRLWIPNRKSTCRDWPQLGTFVAIEKYPMNLIGLKVKSYDRWCVVEIVVFVNLLLIGLCKILKVVVGSI